jgi:hypothetical protein
MLMSRPKLNFCQFCKQDLIRECKPGPGQCCFMSSIGKLVDIGGQVGLSVQEMIDLLKGGVSLSGLLQTIASAAALATTEQSVGAYN